MAQNYDDKDIDFSWRGDFGVDTSGDLANTARNGLLSLENRITSFMISDVNDWLLDPAFGADLNQFIGQPNTEQLGKKVEKQIQNKISQSLLINPQDLTTDVFPVAKDKLAIKLSILALPTFSNKLNPRSPAIFVFLFSTENHGISYLGANI